MTQKNGGTGGHQNQHHNHPPSASPYRNRRFTSKLQKLAPAKKRLDEQRLDLQIKGGHRLTSSLKMKHNQIQFDYQEGQIVDLDSFLAVLAIFKPRKKVMAKIADVSDIILGAETANFFELSRKREEEDLPPLDEDCCLSILFKSSIKTIDLVAPSSTVRRRWYMKLRQLVETAQEYGKIKSDFDLFLLEQFGKADKDGSGIISFKEALELLKTLNIAYDQKEVVQIFNKANFRKTSTDAHSGEDGLDIEEFVEFYHLISYTKSLQEEFFCISKGEELMTREAFRLFLLQTQKVNPEKVDPLLNSLLERFEPLEAHKEAVAKNGHFVSWKGFRNMLISEEFEVTRAETKTVHQDMSRPLTEYYIASSHNTYIPVDQLEGRSTTETYRIYLQDGCRCVELDVTDGDEPEDEPVVFHKRTIMSKMSLREIAYTIGHFGFAKSPYPIIISLENNCKRLDSMRLAAAIFRDELADRLITGPLTGPEEAAMPSPEALKGRIIIKGKRLPEVKEGTNLAKLEEEKNLAKELSDLVWYCSSRHFDLDTSKRAYTQMASVEESKSLKTASKKLAHYRAYTGRHLARVYPFGLRFFSGNYDPLEHWRAGAQLVALNYQTAGNSMLLNRALFARNGSCGYVLKPEPILLRSKEVKRARQLTVTVRVLCGFNLPAIRGCGDILDPFVELRLFGVKRYYRERRRTKTVDNNGLNPEWNREFSFTFDAAHLPLVFLRFRVFDQNSLLRNILVAQRMLAIDALEEGYRNVALDDPEDVRLDHAKLVVEVKKVWTVGKSGGKNQKRFKMSATELINSEDEEAKKVAAEVNGNNNNNHNNNKAITPKIEVTKAE